MAQSRAGNRLDKAERKLCTIVSHVIALWRYLTQGLVPAGALIKG